MVMPTVVSAVSQLVARKRAEGNRKARPDCHDSLPCWKQRQLAHREPLPVVGSVGDYLTVLERDDVRTVFSHLLLMRDEDDGDAALVLEPLEDIHHLDAGAAVEVAGRLVREEDRRIVEQRTRDRDALLLPAELVRVMFGPSASRQRGNPE
jgi:hypothetical protein